MFESTMTDTELETVLAEASALSAILGHRPDATPPAASLQQAQKEGAA